MYINDVTRCPSLQDVSFDASPGLPMVWGPEICNEATRYLSATRGNHTKALSLMEATENWRRSYFKERMDIR